MTGVFSEDSFQSADIFVHLFFRYESLDSSGKSTSVNATGTFSGKDFPAQKKSQRDPLFLRNIAAEQILQKYSR